MKRIAWLDLLRIFSVFFVIIIHVACINWYSENPFSLRWNVLNFYDSISRFCVPAFIMISGALFLSKNKVDIKKLYKKNILRLLIALVFWSFIYAFFKDFSTIRNFSLESFLAFLSNFNGIHYHLHFLLSLVGLYMITPILKYFVEDEKYLNYLLILSIVFSLIIPTINITVNNLSLIFGDNLFFQLYFSFTNWFFKINIPYVSGYLVFFITGYKLYNWPIKNKKIIYFFGLSSLLFTILASSFVSIKLNMPIAAYYDYNTINVYLMAVAIFVFFKEEVSKIHFSIKSENLIQTIAECIFGVYLIHDLFIMIICNLNLYPLSLNYALSVPLFSIIIFIVSFIVIYLIRKIPKVHKYIT